MIETEVKLKPPSAEAARDALAKLGARQIAPRHFEDNFLFDYPEGKLRAKGAALRLRIVEGSARLTYKGPIMPDSRLKEREEIEVQVDNSARLVELLRALGLVRSFRYQKYRTLFELTRGAGPALHIALDETPIGVYLELEGREEAILGAATALGFEEADFIKATYIELFQEHCCRYKLEPCDMIFR